MVKNETSKLIKLFFFLGVCVPWGASAFVPDLGLLVRQQPNLLKANPLPFSVEGSIEIEGEKAPYKLTWTGQKSGYTVEFNKIPKDWTSSPISELILFRDSSYCMLVLNKTPYPCSTLRLWGDFEFNSNSDKTIQSLVALNLATSADLAFKQVTAVDFDPNKRSSKVKPVAKAIQGTFMSVLEYSNGNNLMDFDSTTYAPLMFRLPVDGMTWELVGSPDFNVEKEESRNNLIISKKIEIREGTRLLGVVRRSALTRLPKATLPALPSSRGSVTEVPYDKFNEKGKNFLKILFLTH